ncbi:PREDICTED: growth arrest and DNA damage-inducible protein GADD45 gamma [Charadrius vociferus]|nr:PREDICTED: growth arrest and DNA damage-inducible protein GADD45 gamma [Charadrius vociferus]
MKRKKMLPCQAVATFCLDVIALLNENPKGCLSVRVTLSFADKGAQTRETTQLSAEQRTMTMSMHQLAMPLFVDPDNVAFCVLATDEEDEGDIALQIHFTLIQAFCCENDIDIVRVNDVAKLAAIVGPSEESGEPRDLHCILITNPNEDGWKDPALEKLNSFCEESRNVNDWVPTITLPE